MLGQALARLARPTLLRRLLALGALPNARFGAAQTPLHYLAGWRCHGDGGCYGDGVAESDFGALVDALLRAGARPNVVDANNQSVLQKVSLFFVAYFFLKKKKCLSLFFFFLLLFFFSKKIYHPFFALTLLQMFCSFFFFLLNTFSK